MRAAQRYRAQVVCKAPRGGLAQGGGRKRQQGERRHGRVRAGERARRATPPFTCQLTFTGRHLRQHIRPSLKFDALRFWCGCPSPLLSSPSSPSFSIVLPCCRRRAAWNSPAGIGTPCHSAGPVPQTLVRCCGSGFAAVSQGAGPAPGRAARSTWWAPAGSRERLRGRR